ncbi:hypothetical protein PIB30_086941 [Stylosanthes scabra]|uniref:Uncharacterized protein n=1 Tax=Stylosanthes scabra TaxID=79078 RepID=A0ABU6RTI0_9FABA|nr:hypothetical protein [Stylosanthes scabra]
MRRRMVGTRTTAWDWQWVEEMMAEDDAPRRMRRLPEGGGCRRGGRGRGGDGDRALSAQTQGRARYPLHLRLRPASALPCSAHLRRKPHFDSSHVQFQVDLNELGSTLHILFTALGRTPPNGPIFDDRKCVIIDGFINQKPHNCL